MPSYYFSGARNETRTHCPDSAAAGVLTVTLAGCSAPTNGERSPAFAAAESLQPSEASAAPIGVYEGLLPCGDCAGLRTTIYVRADGTYTRIYTYEGEKDDLGRTPSFSEAGSWKLEGRRFTFTPKDHSPAWLADSTEHGLRLLDGEGSPVEGPLGPMYDLQKR